MPNTLLLKTYRSISEFTASGKTVATLGTFDGVHTGHRKIISRLVATAHDCESVALTFFPHPRMVLGSGGEIKLLNTIDEREALLAETNLDNLIIHPFDAAFSELSAEEFVKSVLVDKLNIQKIIIGHDHKFGKNRTADINDLVLFGKKYNFEVEQIQAQEIDDVAISSTKIRTALFDGDIATANEYLGYPYFISGCVIKGKQLGRTIGFPTANIQISTSYKLIPKIGVYVASALINGEAVYGMLNIGTNPTVGGTQLSIEIFFFNFDADLYDTDLKISILHRLRDETKFGSITELKQQLSVDQRDAEAFIAEL